MRTSTMAVSAALLLALSACGGDDGDTEPAATPTAGADATESPSPAPDDEVDRDLDIPLAAPCEKVPGADVAAVLGGPPTATGVVKQGEPYPPGLRGYSDFNMPASGDGCIYQSDAGGDISIATRAPDPQHFDNVRTNSDCTVVEGEQPFGENSVVQTCTVEGFPTYYVHAVLTPSSLLLCQANGDEGRDPAEVKPLVDTLCENVVAAFSSA